MCSVVIHDTIQFSKKVKKGYVVKKCPGSLYYPLLINTSGVKVKSALEKTMENAKS